MLKKMLLAVSIIIAFCVPAGAQGLVDHWSTESECLAAPQGSPFYVPTLISIRNGRFVPNSNKVVRGLPADSCVEMDLPDRMEKRGFVRVHAGEEMVYKYNFDNTIGELLTMKACNNDVYKVTPLQTVVKRETVVQQTPYQEQAATATASVTFTGPARCPRSNAPGPNNSLWLQEQCQGENPVLVQCLYNCNAPQVAQTEKKNGGCGKLAWKCWVPEVISGGVGFAIGRTTGGGGDVAAVGRGPGGLTGPAF